MRIVYIADDGKEFDDEFECSIYEFRMSLKSINTIEMYDKDGNRLSDPMKDDTYNYTTKIVVHSEDEIKDLHSVADYTGFIGYLDITSVGTWVFNQSDYNFVKEC